MRKVKNGYISLQNTYEKKRKPRVNYIKHSSI